MNPIERAARALAKAQHDVKDLHGATNKSSDQWVEERWRDHVPNVRTVITAIREPSDAMREPFTETLHWDDLDQDDVWQVMIDALLHEAWGSA